MGHNATFTGIGGPHWLATVSSRFTKVKGQSGGEKITKAKQGEDHNITTAVDICLVDLVKKYSYLKFGIHPKGSNFLNMFLSGNVILKIAIFIFKCCISTRKGDLFNFSSDFSTVVIDIVRKTEYLFTLRALR